MYYTKTCETCYAEVQSMYMDRHQSWHEDIRDFINAGDRDWK